MQSRMRMLMSDMPRKILGFRHGDKIFFYNCSLFRWLSLNGGLKGDVSVKKTSNGTLYSGFLPEGVLLAKLHSGKFGSWVTPDWGYQINFDCEDPPYVK